MYNKHLDYFILAAECKSFSKAAEKAFISTNALIKQINLLERELNLKLFNRSHKGISLTKEGKIIYIDAKNIITFSSEALERAHKIAKEQEETIRIGSSLMCPSKPIVDLWSKFENQYPNIRLEIVPIKDSFNYNSNYLDEEEVDIIAGVYSSFFWRNTKNIETLMDYPIQIAVHKNHRLAKKDLITFDDLSEETILIVRRGDEPCIDKLRDDIENNHPDIKIKDMLPYDINTFNQCAVIGYPMIFISLWSDVHPSLVSKPCDWDYNIPYAIISSKNSSKKVQNFIKLFLCDSYE